MKTLLDDYIFSDTLRYEGHKLIYTPENGEPIVLGGFLGAAVLGALLHGQEEGHDRGISLNNRDGRHAFFHRYEDETLHENGGLLTVEVQALSEDYMELDDEKNILLAICGNDRLYDLAFGLTIDYMEYLVAEQVHEHIYDLVPWTEPFAQWLYTAGFVETRRQHLLAIDWSDPAGVYALAELLRQPTEETVPTFVFDGLSAEQVLNGYWEWLWNTVQTEANLYPDAKVKLAEYKENILKNETNYDDLKPEIGKLQPSDINLFRSWMNQWTDFVQEKIHPVTPQKKDTRQELFLDDVLPVPPERNYVEVKKYILERCRYDKKFENYFRLHKMTEMSHQLTLIFGWFVDDNALGKRMKSKAKK